MDLHELLTVVARIAVMLFGLGAGLATERGDLVWLWHRPGLAIRSLLSMFVVMPTLILAAFYVLDLPLRIELALLLLAICPGAPLLPRTGATLGGHKRYLLSLEYTAAITAVLVTPLLAGLVGEVFGYRYDMDEAPVARTVGMVLLLPLAAGSLLRAAVPDFAGRAAPIVARLANSMLIALAVVVAVVTVKMLFTIGAAGLVVMIATAIVGVIVGHVLGGPATETRVVLSAATATRFPALAFLLARTFFPDVDELPATLLVYWFVAALTVTAYSALRKRLGVTPEPPLAPS